MKDLQKTRKIAANKSVNAKVAFDEKTGQKIQQPVLSKKSQRPNKSQQSEDQRKQSENDLEQTAPISNSQQELAIETRE